MTTHFTFPGDLEDLHSLLDHDGLVDYEDLTGAPDIPDDDNANPTSNISETLEEILLSAFDLTEKTFLGTAPMGLQLAGEQLAAQSVPVALATEHIKDKYLQAVWGPGNLGKNALSPDGLTLDCLQYRSIAFQISTGAGATGTLIFEGSNDGVSWTAVITSILGNTAQGNVSTQALAASTNYFFIAPVMFRYFRARISVVLSGGTVAAFTVLRMIPWQVSSSVQLSALGGYSIAPAGAFGGLAVGGNLAPGAAVTQFPLTVGGVDTAGKVRRFLSDVPGNLAVVGPDPTFSGQASPVLTKDVAPAGMSQQDLLWRILIELRSMSHYLKELPLHLNTGKDFSDTVSDFSDEIRIIN